MDALPAVYRRDRGVALGCQAAAFAAVGRPAEAATAGMTALGIARDCGSGRIIRMMLPLRSALASYADVEEVVRLRAALDDCRAA